MWLIGTVISIAVAARAAPEEAPRFVFHLDPVELIGGREAAGDPSFCAEHAAFEYRFISAANRDRFLSDIDAYRIQMDGACARMGPLASYGDPNIWLIHDQRLYIFRTSSCRDAFSKRPAAFLPFVGSGACCSADDVAEAWHHLDRAVAAAGGHTRLAQLRSWRYTARKRDHKG